MNGARASGSGSSSEEGMHWNTQGRFEEDPDNKWVQPLCSLVLDISRWQVEGWSQGHNHSEEEGL